MGKRQQERKAPPDRGRGHCGCQPPSGDRHFRLNLSADLLLPAGHTCCLYDNGRDLPEPDLHPASLHSNRQHLGTVTWHSRAWKELPGGTQVALTVACGRGCCEQLGGCKHMNRSCGQEGISGASLRPEGSAPTLKPLPLAGAPVPESSRRENSLLPGRRPHSHHLAPQRCRPLVSACLFFSNPCFLSKLLSDGA